MNFAFSEEQEELRKSVRRFLEDKSPETEVRRLMETTEGYDPAVWNQMAEQLGLQGLAIPEEFGGSGYTYVELIVVLEEMGRALLCAPYFSTVALAANALLTSGDDAGQEGVPARHRLGRDDRHPGLHRGPGRWDEAGITMAATKRATAGTAQRPQDVRHRRPHGQPDPGRGPHRRRRRAVRRRTATPPGLTRTPLSTMDQTRKQARLEFADTPARLIGTDGEGWATLAKTLDLAAVALAAEQVGGAQKVLEMAVEYAKVRVQFGRPIGSFQAIKHKCADMLLEVESAKSAAYYAGWAAAEDNDELPVVASLAKAYCSEAYFHATAENIQIHGGIGFTWEHPAHLYFKRAKSQRAAVRRPHLPPRAAGPAHRHLSGGPRPASLARPWSSSSRSWWRRSSSPSPPSSSAARPGGSTPCRPGRCSTSTRRCAGSPTTCRSRSSAVLSHDDVRRIIDWNLEYFRTKGVSGNGSGPHLEGPVVVGGAETVDWVLARAEIARHQLHRRPRSTPCSTPR